MDKEPIEVVLKSFGLTEKETKEPPKPFPTTLVATVSNISAAIVGLGPLVYFKKRKY